MQPHLPDIDNQHTHAANMQQSHFTAIANLTTSVDALAKATRKSNVYSYIKGAAIVGFAGVYLYGASMFFGGSSTPDGVPYVSVVKIQGPIADGKDASYATLAPALKAAFEDKDSKGVLLQINSPGGTPVQSSLIHDLILDLKKKHQKKVIAVGEDMMTSGAYFISVAADDIYVNRSTIAGSIGVISAGFGFNNLIDKLGVERRVTTAGTSKNMGDSFLPVKEADVAIHQELLSEIHTHFKDEVLAGRGQRLKLETPGLFEGKVWTGAGAEKVGLVDGQGSLTSVAETKFGATEFKYFNKKNGMDFLSNLGVETAKKLIPELSATNPVPQAIY